jgi:hypothetical protein
MGICLLGDEISLGGLNGLGSRSGPSTGPISSSFCSSLLYPTTLGAGEGILDLVDGSALERLESLDSYSRSGLLDGPALGDPTVEGPDPCARS